jgi:hypothetical protein
MNIVTIYNKAVRWFRSLCERAILWAVGHSAIPELQAKHEELTAQIAQTETRLTDSITDAEARLKEAEIRLKEADAAQWGRVREHLQWLHASKRDVPNIFGSRPTFQPPTNLI